ncbi:MAG: hypothetical protein AB7U66_00260 [Hyphomicrobiaceae bacterium]
MLGEVDATPTSNTVLDRLKALLTGIVLAAGDNLVGRVKISDGTDVADVLDLTNANPIATAIVDGNGDQITSFGGGTQYTEGDTDASITGTAMLWEDGSDTLRAVSAAKPLPVSVPTDPFGADADAASASGSISAKLRSIATNLAAVITSNKVQVDVATIASVPSHAVTNAGTFAVQATEADGANVTLGAKTDAKSTATDATSVTAMQVLKQISASVQAPPSQAVTNAGTFAAQVTSVPSDPFGANADAAATAGSTGSISAKLRAISRDIVANIVLAAGTNLIGRVSSSDETSTLYNGTTALTPKFAAIAAATSGNNTLVAAVSGKKIRVLAIAVVAAGAVDLYFTSAAGGTVIFGGSTNKIGLAANGGFVLPYNPLGWFENSTTNQLLNMNLSGAVAVSGGLVYVEV